MVEGLKDNAQSDCKALWIGFSNYVQVLGHLSNFVIHVVE